MSNRTLITSSLLDPIIPYVKLISVFMVITFTLGILLNLISIILILKSKKIKPVSLLMLNLTIADIVYTCGIPLFITNVFSQSWPFDAIGCQIFFFTDFIGMSVGVYTVTALSVERYIEVTDKKKRMEKISDKFKLVLVSFYLTLVWCVAFSFYMPIISSIKATKSLSGAAMCETTWLQSEINNYFIIKFVLSFIIPFSIILFSSVKLVICLREWHQISKRNQIKKCLTDSNTGDNYSTFKRKKTKIFAKGHKAIKIVLSIVFLFVIQWTPLWVFELYKACQNDFIQNVQLINVIISLISYTNSISNPLLYVCFTHKKYIEKKFDNLLFKDKRKTSVISD